MFTNFILDTHHQRRENRWSKCIDECHEEYFQYNYNYNYDKTPERIVPSSKLFFSEILPIYLMFNLSNS